MNNNNKIKATCCEELENEGIALIQTSVLIQQSHINTDDIIEILNAVIESVTHWRDIIRDGPKPHKKETET